jgi:protein tyrosine/serine phosphatase
MPKEALKSEQGQAAADGMIYTNVPLAGVGRPTDAQVAKILSLIESSPSPVFVHCEHGCDRTGTIIACYRIQHDQWSGAAALQEARKYGMSKLERGMRNFVLDFARSTNKPVPATPPVRP